MGIVQRFKEKFPNLNTILVVIAIVLIWRCVWSLVDIYLLPENPLYSYIAGGIIGVVILLLDDMKLTELQEGPTMIQHEHEHSHPEIEKHLPKKNS